MATGTAQRGPQATPPARKSEGRWLEYDQFIDKQLRRARGQVKSVELAGALMTLAAGGLLYFLAVSLVDHWMFTGGLGFGGRLFFFALFLAIAAWYIVRRLAPLVLLRINPIYAAETIEKSKPSLKNSLINFLFLRGERSGVPQVIYQAVEEQAASNLQRTPVEATVDRTKLIHIGYVLLAAVALFAAYKLFSPKDPIDTVGRIVMPWADIQAPTRVTIFDVQPGSRIAYLGETVEISAELRGVAADEPVRILYTTGDRQTVDQAVTMYRAPDAFRHTGKIPAGESGLQQDIEYRIEAGDAISPTYLLTAAAAPTIAVESIDYVFPAYTGKGKSHVENTGDIQALVGTRVTIHGRANQPLKSAQLVLDGPGGHADPAMKIDGRSVTATFVLALDEKDRAAPKFSRYQLRPNGRLKPEPAQYKIDVFADLAPEIAFLAPENDEVAVPVNGSLPLEVRAVDPDFALAEVTLSAEVGEKSLIEKKLLSGTHSGPLVTKFLFEPAKLRLKEGDSVNYWATAKDNRTPEANEAHTKHRQIRIVKAEQRRPSAAPPKEPNKNPPEPNANPQDQPQDQSNHNPKDQNDQPRDEKNPNNPDNKQKQQDDNGKRDNPKQDKPPENGAQPPNDDKPQDNKQGDNKQGDNKQGDNKQGDNKQGDSKQGDSKQGDNKQQSNGKADKQDATGKQGSKQSDGGGEQQKQDAGGDGSGGSGQKSAAGKNGKPPSGEQKNDGSSDGQPGGDRADGHGAQGQPQPNASQPGNPQSAPGGNEQSSPSDTAQDWKALKDALDKQDQDGAGHSGQSSDKQAGGQGAQGSSQDKKTGGDHAADGSSPNPSTDPRGSGGPFPNGKPGTGGKENNKPKGDQSDHQPSDSKQQPGEKTDGPRNSAGHQNRDKTSGDKNAADKPNGDKSAADKPNGDQKSDGGDKPTGEKSNADKSAGEKPSGSQSPMGDKSHGEDSQPAGQPKPADKSSGNPQSSDKSKSGDRSQSGQKTERGSKPNADKNSAPNGTKAEAGDKASPDKKDSNAEKGENKPGANDPSKEGQGAQAKAGSPPGDKKTEKPDGDKQNPNAKGGDPQSPKGSPSAGQKNTDDKGSPSPQEGSKPNEQKTDSPGSPKQSDSPDNAKSPSNSPKESNSQGAQEGDRSGNGGKGGGQTSKNPGTGGAGSSTAADEGKGASKGPGKGEDSNKPGTDKQSERSTGQAGDKKGPGSDSSDKPADQGKPSNQPGGDKPDGGGADSGFGGNRTGPLPDGAPPDTSPINGDEANKDFARKQFDLALDKLKKGNPDLLKDLNWTANDARKLAERLEQMKAAAKKEPQGDAAKKMDDLLRSLGSRAGQLTRRGDGASDKQHGLLESNNSGPPAEYLDQFEAFQQGTLRGGK